MSFNQKGFTLIEIALAVVLVGVLGLGGWMMYQRNNSNDNANVSPDAQQTENTDEITTDIEKEENAQSAGIDTSSWKKQNAGDTFSFKHPELFTPFVKCDNFDWVYARYESNADPDFNSKVTVDSKDCHGFGDIVLFSIETFQPDGTSKRGVSTPAKIKGTESTFPVNGTKGTKICSDKKEKPFPESPAVIKECQYIIDTGHVQIWGSYQRLENTQDKTNTMDAVMSSIEFM